MFIQWLLNNFNTACLITHYLVTFSVCRKEVENVDNSLSNISPNIHHTPQTDFKLRIRKNSSPNFQLRLRRNPNFQLRVRKRSPNFQLRVRKDPNFQLRMRKAGLRNGFQLRVRKASNRAVRNFQLRVRKSGIDHDEIVPAEYPILLGNDKKHNEMARFERGVMNGFQLRVRKAPSNFQLRVRKAPANFQLRVRKDKIASSYPINEDLNQEDINEYADALPEINLPGFLSDFYRKRSAGNFQLRV